MEQLIQQLATRIKEEGGRAMLNGGCVRDEIMGRVPKDFDVEVYGLSPEKLREVISEFGKVDAVGASFQVYKVGQDIDVSLPRRERKTGAGHKGFTVEGDPYMSFEEACSRRDFTVNAILKDALTGEIVDPYDGFKAIREKVLEAVSEKTFQEDSLRVLRLAQFASRLKFRIEQKTLDMAREADLSDLPKERVWMELEKLFLKSVDPSVGASYLKGLKITQKLFPSYKTNERTLRALQKAPSFANDLSNGQKLALYVAIFSWASESTLLDEMGLSSVDGYNVRKKVEELREYSGKPLSTDYHFHKLSQQLDMKLYSRLLYAFGSHYANEFADTVERLGIEEKPVEPVLLGRHLIDLGFTPSSDFSAILSDVYDRQLRSELTTLEEAKAFVLASH